jgi:hypothetical protein
LFFGKKVVPLLDTIGATRGTIRSVSYVSFLWR